MCNLNDGTHVCIINRAGRWSRLNNENLHFPDETNFPRSADYTHTSAAIRTVFPIRLAYASLQSVSRLLPFFNFRIALEHLFPLPFL